MKIEINNKKEGTLDLYETFCRNCEGNTTKEECGKCFRKWIPIKNC